MIDKLKERQADLKDMFQDVRRNHNRLKKPILHYIKKGNDEMHQGIERELKYLTFLELDINNTLKNNKNKEKEVKKIEKQIGKQIDKIEKDALKGEKLPVLKSKSRQLVYNTINTVKLNQISQDSLKHSFSQERDDEKLNRFVQKRKTVQENLAVKELKILPQFAGRISPILPATDKLVLSDFKLDHKQLAKGIPKPEPNIKDPSSNLTTMR